MFSNIFKLTDKSSHRESSWDRKGKNFDHLQIKSKETRILADIEGPGIIRHMYFTTILQNPLDFRNAVIRMYWDDEKDPSVEVPLGDFFGVCNCRVRTIKSLMITINRGILGSYGYNNYFPMPFSSHARIEIENQGTSMLGGVTPAFWYHVDYEMLEKPFAENIGYFHAYWNKEITKIPDKIPGKKKNTTLWNGRNLTGEDNYVILDAKGNGQLAGLLLCIDNHTGIWYGEGDDMIFIDEDLWPPSFHGTGTEEIFGGGASPKHEYSGPYTGFHLIENFNYHGNNGMYRWYINDTIRFKEKIRWTLEHGHANNFENEYSSVAFWYQKEPHQRFPLLLPPEKRKPRLPTNFNEIWTNYTDIAKEMFGLSRDPSSYDEKREVFYQDIVHQFMQGKYQIANDNCSILKKMMEKK